MAENFLPGGGRVQSWGVHGSTLRCWVEWLSPRTLICCSLVVVLGFCFFSIYNGTPSDVPDPLQILLALHSPQVTGGFGQYSELCLRFNKWSLC